jgi:hypothetical protein
LFNITPDVEHEWYEKDPDNISEKEFKELVNDLDQKLKKYDEILFYYNPGRFHPLYKRILNETKLKKKVKLFTHIKEIVQVRGDL